MPGRNVPITGEPVLGPDRRDTAWIGVVVPWIGVAVPWIGVAVPWIGVVVPDSTEACGGGVAGIPAGAGTGFVSIIDVVVPHGGAAAGTSCCALGTSHRERDSGGQRHDSGR